MTLTAKRIETMADARVEFAIERRNAFKEKRLCLSLMHLLTGMAPYTLKTSDETEHDCKAILEAIYRFHQRQPQQQIDKYLFETFRKLMDFRNLGVSAAQIKNTLSLFMLQLENQENGKSTFKLDMLQLFKEYVKMTEEFGLGCDFEIMAQFKKADKYISSHYGYRILRQMNDETHEEHKAKKTFQHKFFAF